MRPSARVYDAWARLLRYPGGNSVHEIVRNAEVVLSSDPNAWDGLRPLLDALKDGDAAELEELFTRTFDNNPERALEVGWHLYGENYARGAFMVRMREWLRECHQPEGTELPDHISNVLAVAGRLAPHVADALVKGIALPALARIGTGFPEEPNPYRCVVERLARFLETHHGALRGAPREEAPNHA